METSRNPFDELDEDVVCPPKLRGEIFSEIDLIRNTLQLVELFAYDIFLAFTTFVNGGEPTESVNEKQNERS